MEDYKKKKFKELVKKLESIRGRHTELVTVYIPAGFNFNTVVSQLRSEQSTAMNIKSKTVRKNVTGALERVLQHLKLYRQTPENGLAIFCGNVSEREGVADIQVWAIEPPEPVKIRLYRCDQVFVVEPLKDMVREKEVYGLIVLDKSEADIGLLKGKRMEVLKHLDSLVPGKTHKGGQSAARFARVREGLLLDFMKKVGEVASAQFKELKDLRGVIVGGPGLIHDKFVQEDYLAYDIKKKVLGTANTSYTGEHGLRELIERAEDILEEASVIKEKKVLDKFFDHFAKDTGMALYGLKEVESALKAGNVETLLISEEFDWLRVRIECSCGYGEEKVMQESELKFLKCPKCGGQVTWEELEDLTDRMIETAEQMGTEIIFISVDTPKGAQLKELGGVAGLLRYKV